MRTIVLVLALAFGVIARAEEPAAPEPQHAKPAEPPAPPPVGPRERLLAVAQRIPLRAGIDELQTITAQLGEPAKLAYSWCNKAGCVDHGTRETGATKMTVMWLTDTQGDKEHSLFVSLCGGLGAWKVGNVMVYERATKSGAWGTSAKPVAIFRKTDDSFFFGTCWGG